MEITPIESRIRLAGLLIGAGLLLALATMLQIHPLAFVTFAVLGCPLICAGVALYLWSLVAAKRE
ncbi:MAG: hypothetical protein ABI824_18780 [Acidobacteriota bacterium]